MNVTELELIKKFEKDQNFYSNVVKALISYETGLTDMNKINAVYNSYEYVSKLNPFLLEFVDRQF